MRRLLPCFVLSLVMLFAATARAEDEPARDDADADEGSPPPSGHPVWGPPRFFVSGLLDAGYLFLRPRFHFGYGIPHDTWFGVEANPLISGQGVGAYAGIRGELPWIEARVGARYFFTFERSFLDPRGSYDHLEIENRSGPPSRYFTAEAQVELKPDLVRLDLMTISFRSEITASAVLGVPEGYYVFEETIRVITDPPWIGSIDAGFRFAFGPHHRIYVEPRAEVLYLAGREALVWRVGLQAGIQLWPDFEVRVVTQPLVIGPDDLGAIGANTFFLGLRYRWATDRP